MSSIFFYRGDSYPIEVNLTNSNNKPLDVSGYTFTMTVNVKKNPLPGDTALFTVAGTVINASAGKIEFTPTSGNTDLAPGEYWFDISMSQHPTYKRTIAKDIFQIAQDINKS